MKAPALTPAEAEGLIDELAAALEEMVDQSCIDMAPLWVEATRAQRAYLTDQPLELGFTPSPRYQTLSKGARSRYRGLAAWRHAVIWRRVRPKIPDREHREAMEAVYFTAYPDNCPPYAWSSRAAEAPDVARFPSPTTLKHQAKEGCWESVRLLRAERRRLETGHGWRGELVALLLQPGTRDSLRDELKLEDHPQWEER